jgi:hypothetical protein
MLRTFGILLLLLFQLTIVQLGHASLAGVQPPQKEQTKEDEAVKNLEGTVEVSFKIDGMGRVQIVNMNASNPQLADYVIKKLNKIKLNKSETQDGKIIKYRFVFKKQA